MAAFIIRAAPGTDIWRKPPNTDVFNAPVAVSPEVESNFGPLQSFVSAFASISFVWTEQYDQAGLLICLGKRSDSTSMSPPPKWIKTGIELYNGKPMLSTVACDAWADWSVTPLALDNATPAATRWTTIAIQKEQDEHGVSLWIYQILQTGEKLPLREVAWVFGHDPDKWDIKILAMAARPEKKAAEPLEVHVRDMHVNWEK